MSGNASSNNTYGRDFFRQINPELSSDDVKNRRIRCYGHILNLVKRVFLYSEDFELFKIEIPDTRGT